MYAKLRAMYTVYIIECADGSLYTGITTDLKRRLEQHAAGVASRYTRAKGFRGLRYHETQPDRSSAQAREYELKHLPRKIKLQIIAAKD